MKKLSGRRCSRASCVSAAIKTLTYIYSDSTAVLGPLSTYAEPHNYDLCAVHSERLTVPVGWNVIKEELHNSLIEGGWDQFSAGLIIPAIPLLPKNKLGVAEIKRFLDLIPSRS